jgi:glycosyltransferase involved in cell wall biosynthesis
MTTTTASARASCGASRVLYISSASPVPSKIGPSRRHYHILGQLLRFYDVQLLSIGRQTDPELFEKQFGNKVVKFDYAVSESPTAIKYIRKSWLTLTGRCDFLPARNRTLRTLCKRVTASQRFDAIILSTSLLNRLPLPRDVPIVADTHNVESDVLARTSMLAETFGRRMYARFQRPSTFKEERRCTLKAALLLATSEHDKTTFQRLMNVPNIAVIPNGVDLREFRPIGGIGEPGEILFTGLMSYYPNQQAIRWFLEEVFPKVQLAIPAARLIVAGAAPPQWLLGRRSPAVVVSGAVPDMRPYFHRARVVIAPLKIGGGTRVKILEAQAMERPVVSTSLGAEGLNTRSSAIVLADDADCFAAQVIRLLCDDTLALQLAVKGRQIVEREYDWDHIGERLEAILSERIGLKPKLSVPRGQGPED